MDKAFRGWLPQPGDWVPRGNLERRDARDPILRRISVRVLVAHDQHAVGKNSKIVVCLELLLSSFPFDDQVDIRNLNYSGEYAGTIVANRT